MKKLFLLGLLMSVNAIADCDVSLHLKSIDDNSLGGHWGERSIRESVQSAIRSTLERKGYSVVENSANAIDLTATFGLATHWEAGVMEVTRGGQSIDGMESGQVVPGVNGEILINGTTVPGFSLKLRHVVQGLSGLKGTRALNEAMLKTLAESVPDCR